MSQKNQALRCTGGLSIFLLFLTLILTFVRFLIPFSLGKSSHFFIQDTFLILLSVLSALSMFAYLFCSIRTDKDVNPQKALIGWGTVLLSAIFGSVVYGVPFSFPAGMSTQISGALSLLLFMIPVLLILISVFANARGVSGKANGVFYLLASIIPVVYAPVCSLTALGFGDPSWLWLPTAIAAPLFTVFIILDLICYQSTERKQKSSIQPSRSD